jgi:hypothetical protein
LEVEASDFRKKAAGVGTRASLIAISGLIFLFSLIKIPRRRDGGVSLGKFY